MPQRSGIMDRGQYAIDLRKNVRQKMESLIPKAYHSRIAYAIAIEETEAWILPVRRYCRNVKYNDYERH